MTPTLPIGSPQLSRFAGTFLLALGLCLLPASNAMAAGAEEQWEERDALLQAFKQEGVTGTIVVMDTQDRRWIAADSQRAYERYLPASTFKIPNTLIALETGVARDASQVWKWDGKKRSMADWNQDLTLTQAFHLSAVWVYQDIARSIGAARMQQYLYAFHYGNARISPRIDQFWLADGDLRISAVEQIDFLRRLNEGRLPLSARTVEAARRVMLQEETAGHRLFFKTGWTGKVKTDGKRGLGWFVGWLERGERKTFFALNIDMPAMAMAPKRERIARQVLSQLGYLR